MDNLFGFRGGDPRVLINGVIKPSSRVDQALEAWRKFQRAVAACDADEKEEVNEKTWGQDSW